MRRFVNYLLLTGLLAGCDTAQDPIAPASSDLNPPAFSPGLSAKTATHFTIREQLSEVEGIENPCTGEVIPFTATRFEETNVVEESEILHFQVTESISGSGTAQGTGTRYLVYDVSHFSFQTPNLLTPELNVFDMPHTIKLISQGDSENFLEHVVFHLAVLPSGEIKTTVEFDKPECQG